MQRPADYSAALSLVRTGMTWHEAQTLIALRHGLPAVRSGWTLRELGHLELLRYLTEGGTLGGETDGISTPRLGGPSASSGVVAWWRAVTRGR